MKKTTLLIVFMLISILCFPQKKVFSEERIDDMTGHLIRKTVWVNMKMEMQKVYYSRFCQINDLIIFDLKVITGFVTSVNKDADFIIKFSDNSTLVLKNIEYIISGRGEGAIGLSGSEAQGINPRFQLSKSDLELLSQKEIRKIRLYLNDGYIETEIKSKKANEIQNNAYALLNKFDSKIN